MGAGAQQWTDVECAAWRHLLHERWHVGVERMADHVVDVRQTLRQVLRRPVAEVQVQQTLVSTWVEPTHRTDLIYVITFRHLLLLTVCKWVSYRHKNSGEKWNDVKQTLANMFYSFTNTYRFVKEQNMLAKVCFTSFLLHQFSSSNRPVYSRSPWLGSDSHTAEFSRPDFSYVGWPFRCPADSPRTVGFYFTFVTSSSCTP